MSFPTMLFTSFILVLTSTTIAPTPAPSPNYPMLEKICHESSHFLNERVCVRVLQSIPKISLAKGLQNLAIAIIESGISNSTKTQAYRGRSEGGTEDMSASYELLTSSTDYVKFCDQALAKQNVKYKVISRGNKAVPIFGLSAFSVVNQLDDQSRFPPPPNA